MRTTPKSLRLQIGLFGRTNVGKSSFLNMVSGQDVAITSSVPGTTTDVVEKVMELLPIGPVVFLDTGGIDDTSVLAERRVSKTHKIFDRSDVIVLVAEPGVWTEFEETVCREAAQRKTPLIVVVNKIDLAQPQPDFLSRVRYKTEHHVCCSTLASDKRTNMSGSLKAVCSVAVPMIS